MKIVHSEAASGFPFKWNTVQSCGTVIAELPSWRVPHPDHQSTSTAANAADGVTSLLATKSENDLDVKPPRDRYAHTACCVGNYVYIYGGKDRYCPFKDLWRLDVSSGQWESLASWSVDLPHLQGHSMTALRSQIFIFGGWFGDPLSEETPLWILNTDLGTSRQYRPAYKGCAHPSGRREHTCVAHRNSLYLYGGFIDSSGSSDEFWVFSTEAEEWRSIRRRKPGKRHGHIAVVAGEHMWLHGGMRELKSLSDMWTFNFAMCTWDAVKSLGVSPPLSNHSAHLFNDFLILFGGYRQGQVSNSIWLFQFGTVTWRQVGRQQGELCPPIALHASVILTKDQANNSSTDRTQSVPHLRHQDKQHTVRPWTSPDHGGQSDSTLLPPGGQGRTADVLRLKDFEVPQSGLIIDKNNNASEEDLTGEAETSFYQTDRGQYHAAAGLHSLRESLHLCYGPVPRERNLKRGSESWCHDELPLLQRFQSVTSSVDLGEVNKTLSLSDERVSVGMRYSGQLALQSDPCGESQRSNFDSIREQVQQVSSEVAIGAPSRGRSCCFENPLYSEDFSSSTSSEIMLQTSSTQASEVSYHPEASKNVLSISKWNEAENIPPQYDDMILEDLENSDIDNLFHNVDISKPSTFSVSLDELNCRASRTQLTYNCTQSKKKALHSSIGNLYLQHGDTNIARGVDSVLSRETARKRSVNDLEDSESVPQCPDLNEKSSGVKSGRYTKSTATSSRHLGEHRGQTKCFSATHLDKLVTTCSTGTQTSGSQLCIDPNSQLSSESKVHSPRPVPRSISSDVRVSNDSTVAISMPLTRQAVAPKPLIAACSVLGACQSCLLVIGGRTQSASFTPEPIKLWRCQLS